MPSKRKYDFSEVSSDEEALSWVSSQLRAAAEYDAYGSKTSFQVRVLTRPMTVTGEDAAALLGGPNPPLAATRTGTSRFMFKGRILGEENGPRSPHATIPDPCDLSIADDSECSARIMSWHTTFVSAQAYDGAMPDIGDIVQVTLNPGDLGKYNLQFATFNTLEEVGGLATENATCQANLKTLFESFDGANIQSLGSFGNIPPPILGGPSTVSQIKQAYPRIAAQSGLAEKIVEVAKSLSIPDPGWLANAMGFETGYSFDPAIVNGACLKEEPASKCATGLIQFIPSTATNLGTTVTDLAKMNAVAQMDFVLKYFQPHKGRLNTAADLYMAIYYPKAVGKGPNYSIYNDILQRKGIDAARLYYRRNGGIRTAGDYTNLADRGARLPNQLAPTE